MPYEQAHKIMAEAGRKPGRGMFWDQFSPVYDTFGQYTALDVVPGDGNYRNSKRGQITLKRFLRENPVGTYIVNVKQHVFTVKDGVIFDSFQTGPNKRVSGWWKIYKVT
jgi:hypothetical protein